MSQLRRPALLGVAILLVALTACSGKDSTSSAPTATGTMAARASAAGHGLLIPRDQRLLLRDMKDGKDYVVKPSAPANVFYAWPRWSPDGRQIAYVLNTQYTGLPNQDWGADIAVSDADGSNERVVYQHPQAGVTIEGLAWLPDGSGFIAGFLETTIKDGRFIGQTLRLDRYEIATGARRTIAEEAAYPTVAPDGSRIAYIAFSTSDGPGGLWTANPDGSDARLLVPTSGRFLDILSPRYSPDGRTIAFAAVAGNADAKPGRGDRAAFRWPWQARVAAAHGLPMDVWTVPADGGEPRKLTDMLEDEPSPAWSPDGAEIAIIAAGGLYVVPSAGGSPRKVGLGGTQTQIDWR
jgi:Tol biopolymer transport system component